MMFLKVVGDHISLFTFNLSTIGINSMGFVFVTYRKAIKDQTFKGKNGSSGILGVSSNASWYVVTLHNFMSSLF